MIALSTRFQNLLGHIRSGIGIALMTAVLVIIIASLVSFVFGGESRRLFEQSVFNGEEVVDHAIVSRCETAQIVRMLRDVGDASMNSDLSEKLLSYPEINIEGLDCATIISEPFRVGNDFGLEGPPSPSP